MCAKFPGRLALGVDARNGLVATDGWLETSAIAAVDLVEQFDGVPLAAIIYTDIATDGMLAGPNVAAMRQMQAGHVDAGDRLRRRDHSRRRGGTCRGGSGWRDRRAGTVRGHADTRRCAGRVAERNSEGANMS